MSVPTRQLSRQILSLSRRPAPAANLLRQYSTDRPYPFTKPSFPGTVSKTTSDQSGAQASHPFTKPSEPTPVPSPTRPVNRAGPSHDPSHAISNEAEDALDVPRPDYNVAEADYRTGTFSPIPMRVQDGSEEMDTAPAAVTSGAPVDLQGRTVR